MESWNELQTRHKAEVEDLNKKIESLKAPLNGKKADKNQKKGIMNKVDNLKRELEIRQEEEIYQWNVANLENEKNEQEEESKEIENKQEEQITQDLKHLSIEKDTQIKKKKNRQKERKERKQANLLKLMEEAEQEASNQTNVKQEEEQKILNKLSKLNLKVYNIPSNGHCLYNAVADQLALHHNIKLSYKELRSKAAEYIRDHRDDFLPYLPISEEDEDKVELSFKKYCDEIENTPVWGGQLEIMAMANALNVPIHVYQADTDVVDLQPQNVKLDKALKISYHLHAYTLGAHYNSLREN